MAYRQGEKEKNWPIFLSDNAITLDDMATLMRDKNRIYGNEALEGTADAVRKAIWSGEKSIDHISAIFRTFAHELVKAFLAEHPVALRRVGIRVANLAEEKGQRTLGEF